MNRKHYRPVITSLICLAALSLFACSKGKSPEVTALPLPSTSPSRAASPSPSPSSTPDQFACGLLTKEEIQSVQGEAFVSTMPSQGPGPGLAVSQCYFQLPAPVNSVVLTVTRKATGAGARDPRESWREIFYPDESRKKKESEEEEAEKKGPEKIEGIGDEAFWTGNRVGGALYVLKGECYFRISVGGAGDQAQKTEKCKTLAAAVLKRL